MTNHATRLSKNALQMPKKNNKTITSIMVLCTNSPLLFYQHTLSTILYAFQISASTLTVATCEPSFALGSCLMLTPIIPRRNLVVSCPFHLLYHFHRDLRANAYITSRDHSGVHCGGPMLRFARWSRGKFCKSLLLPTKTRGPVVRFEIISRHAPRFLDH